MNNSNCNIRNQYCPLASLQVDIFCAYCNCAYTKEIIMFFRIRETFNLENIHTRWITQILFSCTKGIHLVDVFRIHTWSVDACTRFLGSLFHWNNDYLIIDVCLATVTDTFLWGFNKEWLADRLGQFLFESSFVYVVFLGSLSHTFQTSVVAYPD